MRPFATLRYEKQGAVAVVALDRPEVLKIGVEMASPVERVARFAAPGEGA